MKEVKVKKTKHEVKPRDASSIKDWSQVLEVLRKCFYTHHLEMSSGYTKREVQTECVEENLLITYLCWQSSVILHTQQGKQCACEDKQNNKIILLVDWPLKICTVRKTTSLVMGRVGKKKLTEKHLERNQSLVAISALSQREEWRIDGTGSTQEDGDTRMIIHVKCAASKCIKVVVVSQDTD